MRNRRPGAECLPDSETGEKAGSSLEGGLVSTLRGLRDSPPPCARVLSVAGLLVISGLFPGWRRFILAGKIASFLLRDGGNCWSDGKRCYSDVHNGGSCLSTLLTWTALGSVHTYWEAGRRHITGGGRVGIYQDLS